MQIQVGFRWSQFKNSEDDIEIGCSSIAVSILLEQGTYFLIGNIVKCSFDGESIINLDQKCGELEDWGSHKLQGFEGTILGFLGYKALEVNSFWN